MNFAIEFEQEVDGRWIADIPALPGVMAYGITKADAESKVEALALRVVADRIERENSTMTDLHFAAA
jgi:predicted RNase H-like HicB family nuclease